MTSARIFIGLGGNLGDPLVAIQDALHRLDEHPGVAVVQASRMYASPPWGIVDQPSFVNAVAELRASLGARRLLGILREIEAAHGRCRRVRWGPRTLDLDLLAWGEERISGKELTVPHPRLSERAFVLVPWAEIAPEFEVPGVGSVAALLRAREDATEIQPIEQDEACTATMTAVRRSP